jgi:hypothetical protein
VVGNVLMIGRKTEFRIAPSTLDPGTMALYRGNYGSTLTELATGLASDAKFQFRYGTTTHYNSVTGTDLASSTASASSRSPRVGGRGGGQASMPSGGRGRAAPERAVG